jgi:hypothetical protein
MAIAGLQFLSPFHQRRLFTIHGDVDHSAFINFVWKTSRFCCAAQIYVDTTVFVCEIAASQHISREHIMLKIEDVQVKTQEAVTKVAELNETVWAGAVKATKELTGFYARIIEGKPTDLYHITNAFKKIVANNIEATKQYFSIFHG